MLPPAMSTDAGSARGQAAVGRELVYWIALAAQQLRKTAGGRLETIAHYSGVGVETVRRFESVERFPHELDAIVAAYAQIAGLDDPRDLYEDALELWHERGERPLLPDESPDAMTTEQRAVDELERYAKREARRQERDERGRTSSAAKKRQAGP